MRKIKWTVQYKTYPTYYYDNPEQQEHVDQHLTDFCNEGGWRVHSVESGVVVSMNNGAQLPGRIYLLRREFNDEAETRKTR
jgi:hypothetical protein